MTQKALEHYLRCILRFQNIREIMNGKKKIDQRSKEIIDHWKPQPQSGGRSKRRKRRRSKRRKKRRSTRRKRRRSTRRKRRRSTRRKRRRTRK